MESLPEIFEARLADPIILVGISITFLEYFGIVDVHEFCPTEFAGLICE
jgi:hypothetical protein